MNIILFGPQGSGKGTQADIIAEKYGLYHLSMGDELRREIKRSTSLGKKIANIINGGHLVPDSMTNTIIKNISNNKEAKKGIIFDGYPRRHSQWRYLKKNFDINAAIELHLSAKDSVKRVSTRRVCSECGKNYNIISLKPKKRGFCDIDNAKLIQRIDDKPKEIKLRLKIYHKDTEPVKHDYRKIGLLKEVDGNQPIPHVTKDIVKILNSIRK